MHVNIYSQEAMDIAEHIIRMLTDRLGEQVRPVELGQLVCGLTLALMSFKVSLAHLGIVIDPDDLELSMEDCDLN